MKRLVYSPSVNAWVKTDTGVFDLSPYITDVQVDRRVGEVSSASLTFRNPKVTDERNPKKTRFMFTEHLADDGTVRPMFHPMDPIIITLTRLKGRPIQVFTGYCDTTPYVQLFPGPATITASCTFKRLQYTYWDPALPFVRDFMLANGWLVTDSGQTLNANVEQGKAKPENDSSFGKLLFNLLTEVGGWNGGDISIEGLPSQMAKTVAKLYEDNSKESIKSIKDFNDALYKILGASAYGVIGQLNNSSASSSDSGPSPVLPADAPDLIKKLKDEADRINNAKTRYVSAGNGSLGGGSERSQGALSNPPKDTDGALMFDCSSFVSYMLHFIGKLGFDYAPASDTFLTWGKEGKGKYLTVWTKGPSGPTGHVFLEFMKVTGSANCIGTTSNDDTVTWHNHTKDGFTARHIEGF